jgi:excisionase family DNA binding protein
MGLNQRGGFVMEELLTFTELAKNLKVHITTLQRWVNSGLIPSYRVMDTRRFRFEEVLQAIKSTEKGREET